MTPAPTALSLARPVIVILIALNFAYVASIGALLIGTFVIPQLLFKALAGLQGGDAWQVHAALRAIVVVGIIGAFFAYRVLRNLLAIVDTVRAGDPFVVDNARRLQAIAWWVLAGEFLRLLVGAIAWYAAKSLPTLDIDVDVISIAPWLAVLLLFVLARVFDAGTRMRSDLEGTV